MGLIGVLNFNSYSINVGAMPNKLGRFFLSKVESLTADGKSLGHIGRGGDDH